MIVACPWCCGDLVLRMMDEASVSCRFCGRVAMWAGLLPSTANRSLVGLDELGHILAASQWQFLTLDTNMGLAKPQATVMH